MTALAWDEWDRKLARSIFDSEDERAVVSMVKAWVEAATGARAKVISCEISVGAVIGVAFGDGRKAALKVWPGDHDQRQRAAQVRVQAGMAAMGFPAPRVLVGLSRLGPGQAMLMAHDRSGEPTDVRRPGVRDAMARSLASFIDQASAFLHETDLPDWRVRPEEPLWPKTHNVLFDFAATTAGAEWIDKIATRARAVMASAQSPLVVGHGDWSAKNMRMGDEGLAVLYDWDSVMLAPETFAVGAAAAHFPVTWELPVTETPLPGEMAAFIATYEEARGIRFSVQDLEEIAAYATFSRAYKARCEHCGEPEGGRWAGSSREALQATGGYTPAMLRSGEIGPGRGLR